MFAEHERHARLRALFDACGLRVDPIILERIAELGASNAEIREAIAVVGVRLALDPEPSNERVAEIRVLLAESIEDRQRA